MNLLIYGAPFKIRHEIVNAVLQNIICFLKPNFMVEGPRQLEFGNPPGVTVHSTSRANLHWRVIGLILEEKNLCSW